jgi:hypothetical protein
MSLVEKYDRHGYKQRARVILLTDLRIYGLDVQTLKLKDKINLKKIEGLFNKIIFIIFVSSLKTRKRRKMTHFSF